MNPYLTYQEFLTLSGLTDQEFAEAEFNKLLPNASLLLDAFTNNFYQYHNLENDTNTFRQGRFKRAVLSQILYFHQKGTASLSQLSEASVASVTIGRTSISSGTTTQSNANDYTKYLTPEILLLLNGTGLMYAGVRYC